MDESSLFVPILVVSEVFQSFSKLSLYFFLVSGHLYYTILISNFPDDISSYALLYYELYLYLLRIHFKEVAKSLINNLEYRH